MSAAGSDARRQQGFWNGLSVHPVGTVRSKASATVQLSSDVLEDVGKVQQILQLADRGLDQMAPF